MTDVIFIMIHGGKRDTVDIAAYADWYYGFQFGSTCYGLPYMTDYTGDGSDWHKYMDMLRSHRPRQALVADFRHADEWQEVIRRMCDVAELGIRPVVVHKHRDSLQLIPEYVLGVKSIVGVSVPTKRQYMNDGDGTLPTCHEVKRHSAHFYDSKYTGGKRDIHLLGGHPDAWAYLMQYYAGVANVHSIDGNVLYEQARQYGKLWSRYGYYRELRGSGFSTRAITIASMKNTKRFLSQNFYYPSSRVTMCKQALGVIAKQASLFEELKT